MSSTTHSKTISIALTINGKLKHVEILPGERLSHMLRRQGYWGVKQGCYHGDCGTCSVLLNGRPIASCLKLAAQAHGAKITTVEGLSVDGKPHALQDAFLDEGAAQCGFCTAGMLMSAKALLARNPEPTEPQVREALAGNLCRCTGYEAPIRAVLQAAKALKRNRR